MVSDYRWDLYNINKLDVEFDDHSS